MLNPRTIPFTWINSLWRDADCRMYKIIGPSPHGDLVLFVDAQAIEHIGSVVMCMTLERWNALMTLVSTEA